MTSPSNVLLSGKRQHQQRNPINKLIPLCSAERERETPSGLLQLYLLLYTFECCTCALREGVATYLQYDNAVSSSSSSSFCATQRLLIDVSPFPLLLCKGQGFSSLFSLLSFFFAKVQISSQVFEPIVTSLKRAFSTLCECMFI